MTKKIDGLMLSEAIEKMHEAISNRDLSDKTLRKERCSTRKDDFCSELSYGITMVPCTFAIQLAKKVLEIEGDQFIPFDTD